MNEPLFELPRIAPVEGEQRPFWSVMIPTFNCAKYLRKTLESVLAQDLGQTNMQIEMVDDCSDRDDPENVVQEIGQGRVGFFRQAKNLGHTGNFLTCLRRSKGEAIHLLHGDDYVLAGFYLNMWEALNSNPEIGAAFCRHLFADEDGHWMSISGLEMRHGGIWTDGARKLACTQLIQTPSIVVRRSIYERLGAVDPRLSWTEDWEMWVRIAVHYPIWFHPEPLAVYRQHGNSNTSRLTLTGENVRDLRRCIQTFKKYFPPEEQPEIVAEANGEQARKTIRSATSLFASGQKEAALIQLREALACSHKMEIVWKICHVVVAQAMRAAYRNVRGSMRNVRGWVWSQCRIRI